MSEDLVNRPFNFYDALGKSDLAEYAHALKTLWLVSFELPEIMMGTTIGGIRTSPNISGAYSRINTKEGNLMNTQNAGNAFGGYAWEGIDDYNIAMATTHQWLYATGNLYAHKVMIPGDKYDVSRKNVDGNGRGEAAGLIGTGRSPFGSLQIDFFETNVSFTESVIRPWMMHVAANSIKVNTVKTTIHIALLAIKDGTNQIRKSYSFHDCFPIEVGAEGYDQDSGLLWRSTQFAYNWYSVNGWSA